MKILRTLYGGVRIPGITLCGNVCMIGLSDAEAILFKGVGMHITISFHPSMVCRGDYTKIPYLNVNCKYSKQTAWNIYIYIYHSAYPKMQYGVPSTEFSVLYTPRNDLDTRMVIQSRTSHSPPHPGRDGPDLTVPCARPR